MNITNDTVNLGGNIFLKCSWATVAWAGYVLVVLAFEAFAPQGDESPHKRSDTAQSNELNTLYDAKYERR